MIVLSQCSVLFDKKNNLVPGGFILDQIIFGNATVLGSIKHMGITFEVDSSI